MLAVYRILVFVDRLYLRLTVVLKLFLAVCREVGRRFREIRGVRFLFLVVRSVQNSDVRRVVRLDVSRVETFFAVDVTLFYHRAIRSLDVAWV